MNKSQTETPQEGNTVSNQQQTQDTPEAESQQNKENKPILKKKSKDKSKDNKSDDTKKPSQPLSFKLVASHYDAHSKSNLPHILAEYGLEQEDQKVVKVTCCKKLY